MSDFALGDAEVRDIDATLARLAQEPEPLELNFSNHWQDDDESPALLAAALMGSLASKKVTVDAADEQAVDGLLRFGVATALSRRSPDATSFKGHAERLDAERLGTLWTPASLWVTKALFADVAEEADSFGPRHATFLNPQLSSASDGRPDVVYLVRRWLTKRLKDEGELASEEAVSDLISTVATVVDETVRNVQEHAASREFPRPNCLLRISVESSEKIRCSVLDTGVGVAVSLRERGIEPDLSEGERLQKLMNDEIEGWDAGRGTGLAYITDRVAKLGGKISLATGAIRARSHDDEVQLKAEGFPLQGTVVDCTIPTV